MNLKTTERMLLRVKKNKSSLNYFNNNYDSVVIKIIEDNHKYRQKY